MHSIRNVMGRSIALSSLSFSSSTALIPSTSSSLSRLPSSLSSSSSSTSSCSSSSSSLSSSYSFPPLSPFSFFSFRCYHNPAWMRGVGRRPGPLTHPAARIGRRLKSVEKWDKLSAEERLPILPNKDTTIIHHKEEGLEAWVYGWSDQSFDAKEIIPLNPRVWGEPIRKDIIQRVVHYQRLKAMRGTHSSKSRSQVKGSGKKPFPQKKTGRARQGSRKAPHMWHGGAAHGPKPHSHAIDLPRKIRLMGTRIALSAKYQEGRLLIIDEAKWHTVKTGTLSTFLRQFGMRVEMTLLVYDDEGEEGLDGNLALASRMIPTLDLLPQSGLNVYTMLRHRNILITKSAIEKIEARLDPMRLANRNIRYMVGSKGGGLTYTEYIQQFKDVREKRLAIERSRAVTVLYKDPPLHIVRTLEALPKTWSKIGIGSKMTATDNNDNDNNTPSTPSTTPSTPVPNSFDATVVTASQ